MQTWKVILDMVVSRLNMKNEFCLGCRFLSVLDWLSEILWLD